MVTWSSLPLLQLTSILHQHRTRRHPSKGFRTTVIQQSVLQYNFVVLQFCCSCAERLSLTHVGMLAQALAVTDPFLVACVKICITSEILRTTLRGLLQLQHHVIIKMRGGLYRMMLSICLYVCWFVCLSA